MNYRPAKQSDWKYIKLIISQYPKELLQNHLPDVKKFFVAEDDGMIVGCCALDIYSKRISEIRSLAVLPQYQGNGIGSRLIEMCYEKAKMSNIFEIFAITGKPDLFKGFNTFNDEKTAVFRKI